MRLGKKIIAVLAGWLVLMSGVVFARPCEGGVKNVTGLDSKQSCTIIYAFDGKTALAGNNEDWSNPFPIIWFQPAEDGKFGCMFFGFQDFSPEAVDWHQQEGGMNEKGLFFDFATAEQVVVPRDPNKPDCWTLMTKVMEECSTVDEALKMFSEYNFRELWGGHYLIGDRFGNSAIIEPLTFIRKSCKYQVVTNFFQSKIDPETSTDVRYRLASEFFEQSDTISVSLLRRILDDTHFEDYGGSYTVTLYSYIYDLATGDVYIYNFHDYDNEVKLNIHEELKKGPHSYLISSLFPYEPYAALQYKSTRATIKLIEKAMQNGVTGEDGTIAYYRALKSQDDKPVKYDLGEAHLNAAGYALLQYEKVDEAIDLFSFMVEEFPQSANAYDSRGEAYMKAGNTELAIENYEKSLELDPDNGNATEMLKQLRGNEK